MDKLRKTIISVTCVLFAVAFVLFSEETSDSIIKSISVCINVIIPSMFIYMVLSSYIISSSLYKTIFKIPYNLLNRIIRLDEHLFSMFCLSLIGGYPVGIKLMRETIAQNKNFPAIAEKASAFCYCISPTFAITMIGINLYNSAEIGLLVYIANVITNVIMAIIYSRIYNLKKNYNQCEYNGNLICSITSSSSSLFKICAVIIIFNAVITAAETALTTFGINTPIIIKSIFEISNVLNFKNPDIALLPVISAIASTGGICVLFQSYSLADNSFNLKHFIFARLPSALISGIITRILLMFWDISLTASASESAYYFKFNENKAVIILILIMFIILMQKNEKNLKKG